MIRHWFQQPGRAATVAGGLLGATVADLFMPLFSGQLVDAVTKGGADPAARQAAFTAFGAIVALGATSMLLRLTRHPRHRSVHAEASCRICRARLSRACSVSRPTGTPTALRAPRCARSRAACGRSTCSTTRMLMALLPSLVVLLGSMLLLGWHWPALGGVIAVGTVAYIAMTVWFSTRYIAPAARVSNAWDTKVGGTLADALTCNAVVKSFGAESREDGRLGQVDRPLARARGAHMVSLQHHEHGAARSAALRARRR